MQKKQKWFLIPFLMIVVSFVFWGIGRQQGDAPAVEIVAEIGDHKIDAQTYWRSYERLRDFYRNILKEQFTEEFQKSLDLKQKTLDELVDQRVLLMAAEEHGLAVTDNELQKAIMEDTNFLRDGRFDRNVYLRTLQLNRIVPADYERSRREDMTASKMRRMVLEMVSPVAKGGTDAASTEGADSERRKQMAFKAFMEGYKRKLQKEGRFTLNMNAIS